jgi:tetratricopeptide (TPR) repeat protein/TolB-like protein
MTNPPDLWSRIKQTRVVRVLLVYLGASWVLLQVASTVVDAFKLPDIVLPATIILLAIGVVVIVATAWVQSLTSTTKGEESGALPTDWQIAPRDAIASIKQGRLPHLTWGRVLASGVAALVVLFAAAAGYVAIVRVAGPSPASAAEAAEGIAVVPFEVRGTGLDIWREGMMDLLTNGLDGVGGFRTIDSRTVMARWREHVGQKPADLVATLAVARQTGAHYALEGSVVALGPAVRMVANVYDISTGKEIARGQVEGSPDSVLTLVDQLAVGTMRELLKAVGRAGAADESAETITTSSLPALRAYLEGESHYRKGRFADAVQSYERAVAADSTFAIALVRLSEAYGWLENSNSARMRDVGKRAVAQAHRLSPRYQFIMTGSEALNRNSPDGLASLKEAVRKYPDDASAWFLLAETYLHVGGATYGTIDDIWEALLRATSLDPSFVPYLVHVGEYAVLRGDSSRARAAVDRYATASGNREALAHIELAIPLLLGNDQQVAAALDSASKLPPIALDAYGGTFARRHEHFDRDAVIDSMFAISTKTNRAQLHAWYAGGQGALTRGRTFAEDVSVAAPLRAIYYAYVYNLWNVEPPSGSLDPAACLPANIGCGVIVGAALAALGKWQEHQRIVTMLAEAGAAATDTTQKRTLASAADVLRGIALHRRGDIAGAREMLTRYSTSIGNTGEMTRHELAWLEAGAKRPAEAIRHFQTLLHGGFMRPAALYGIATMHEQLGQADSARAYYARLVKLTEKGEPLPRIVEARNALARLAKER